MAYASNSFYKMEKISQHAVVKQGLIIAYYFSNVWYRKGLFGESQIPDPNDTDPIEHPDPDDLDETDPEEEDIKYLRVQPQEVDRQKNIHDEEAKTNWDEDVENPAIPKKTD